MTHILILHTCVCILLSDCLVFTFLAGLSDRFRFVRMHIIILYTCVCTLLSALSRLKSLAGLFALDVYIRTFRLCFWCLCALLTGFLYCLSAVLKVFGSIFSLLLLIRIVIRLVFSIPF